MLDLLRLLSGPGAADGLTDGQAEKQLLPHVDASSTIKS